MTLLARISTATADERSARLAGVGLMLLSIFMFSFGDALGKFMVATYSVGQLLWLRACAALIVLLPMIWRHSAAFTRLERPWLQLLRVVLSTIEVAAFFLATVYLPLADVITYYLACPIFVTALSALVLREHVGWRRWSAIIVGFIGVLVVARPGLGGLHPAALLSFGGAVCYAFYVISTRLLSRSDSNDTTQFYTNLVGALAMTVVVPFVWTPPDSMLTAVLMVLIGALGGGGHYLLIRAHRLAPASALAPFIYTQMVWTTTLGVLVFGDFPHHWTIIGGSIVIGSGLYLLHRETVVGKPAPSAPVA